MPEQSEQERKEVMAKEKREDRKSWVRVIVTFVAAAFIFVGGGSLIVMFGLNPYYS